MKFAKEQLKLYAITDRSWLAGKTLMEQVEQALKGGATMIQLREKHLDEAPFLQEAEAMIELCHRYQVPLIINDRVELAKKVGADGVHVGQSDMQLARAREILGEEAIIGVTAKTVAQALELTKALMKKYNIPASNVIRHFDVTGKLCPAYWSGRENAGKWEKEFKSRLVEPDYREVLKKRAGLLDPTLDYLAAYKYGSDLIRKLATMK